MDDAMIVRLDLIHQRLQDLVEQISKKTIVTDEELTKEIELIDNYSNQLTTELHFYMEKCSQISQEKVKVYTETQLKTEEYRQSWKALLRTNKQEKSPEATTSTSTAKLPKLHLPKFKGEVLRWSDFWDRFRTNVHEKSLSDADKMAYLVGCLEDEALQSVEGLSINDSNYTVAVTILKERYGNKRKVIDAHYDAINGLQRAGHTAQECRDMFNIIEKHLRVLETLGEPIDGNYLRTSILSKFPEKIVYQLHLLSNVDDIDIDTIRSGLRRIITAMEIAKGDLNDSPSVSATPKVISTGVLHVSNRQDRSDQRREKQHSKMPQRRPSHLLKRKWTGTEKTEMSKKPKRSCIFCDGEHYNAYCTVVKGVVERKKKLGRRCYLCFKEGHKTTTCTYKRLCHYCKGKHNQALCPQNKPGTTSMYDEFCSLLENDTVNNSSSSYLQTAIVEAGNLNKKTKQCRCLLDSGSQRSYMTTQLAKELGLTTDTEDLLMIFVFGADKPVEITSPSTDVEIKTRRGVVRKIHVNIVPHITSKVSPPKTVEGVDIIADDGSAGDQIQILIGNDYYFLFLRNDISIIENNLFLVDTDFGWMVTGKILKENNEDILSVITYCQCQETQTPYFAKPDLPLQELDVKFLWDLEGVGITDSPKTTREEEAVKQFNETVTYENNRYQVKWPWITYPPDLPTNYGLTQGRLSSLLRRLPQDTLEEYDNLLKEQLAAGIIEVIEPTEINSDTHPIHYLPHHIVLQKGKRGRIVYDASAKLKNSKSLNECMYKGPSMIEDLTALLLRFRMNAIGITADVEKAFLQVGLQREARDVTRFLWLKNPKLGVTEENMLHLRFCRVPFGVIASPFLLTATIRHHLHKQDHNLMSEIAERTYVDNLVTGSNSIEEARHLVNKTRNIFMELSMNIRDWTTNSKQLEKSIPKQFRGKDTESTKVLGLTWYIQKDTLKLRFGDALSDTKRNEIAVTKRVVLRTLASLYDPCGFAAPLILPAKLLLQEIWKRKLKWDQIIPEDLEEKWQDAFKALRTAEEIEVPRHVGDTLKKDIECELHCFTDASKRAFSAVVYLRIWNKIENHTKIVFIMAKSRVTPINHKEDLKIPKLELLGFVIGKRLLKYVQDTLRRLCLWCDSEIVLHWIRSEKLLPPFIFRRINEIKQNKDIQTRYVNTEQNPADLATRPEMWHSKKELWFNGPQFLLLGEESWPSLQGGQSALFTGDPVIDVPREELPTTRLEKAAAVEVTEVDAEESFGNADKERIITSLKELQQAHFPDEIAGKTTSLSRNLGLFIDMEGLLRCKGRLMNTMCSYDTKHPILIPKNSKFTDDLIRDTHEKYYHAGAPHTLSIIRQKYWIPQGKAKVQRIIRKCRQCIKHGGGPFQLPPTPALPSERANYSAPFTYTGLDYFGPIFITEKGEVKKRWVCLLTCLAVRAVHMEVVQDLTAEECLLAIRRFVAARGRPELIVSDNALQFKLTAEVLSNEYCRDNGLRWKFIPQLSPWFGGFYERLVGVVKNCMKRTLGKKLLSDTQLSTVIKEIEAVTNSRPLTCVGSDIEYVLRPVDFLTYGKCISIEPSIQSLYPGGSVTKGNLIEGWKKGQLLLQEFKRMFLGQYLCSLRERYQHSHKEPRVRAKQGPQVGNIVQIKGDSKNRENWKVGKIISLEHGADGACRVAKVNVEGKEFIRSIGQLYPLEVEDVESQDRGNPESSEPPLPRTTTSPEIEPRFVSKEPIIETDKNVVQNEVIPLEEHNETDLTQKPENKRSVVENEEVVDTGEEVVKNAKEDRTKRTAAVKAREKIALWTNQLAAIL